MSLKLLPGATAGIPASGPSDATRSFSFAPSLKSLRSSSPGGVRRSGEGGPTQAEHRET